MRRVGDFTCVKALPARSGLPPRETTASTRCRTSAAATSRGSGAGARPKIADADLARHGLRSEPLRHFREPTRQEGDIKPQTPRDVVFNLLFGGQEIKEQRAIARFADNSRDKLITRTVPTAATTVREDHDAGCSRWDSQLSIQRQ
jgi:hypothetical protein